MEKRFATVADYDSGRQFVGFHLKADRTGIHITEQPNIKIFHAKGNVLRLGPYDRIENVELGTVMFQTSTEFSYGGYLVDYAENAKNAEHVVTELGWKIRDRFINELQQRLDAMKNVTVHRTTAP